VNKMPYQKLLLFACAGVFAAQVSSAQIKWGTYYGGAATEDGYGVATDAAGNVYMTGYSLSTNNIATAGSHQPSFVPGPFSALDAYLVKFDSTGVRQWGTYYGNSGGDVANCIAIDPWGYVYIAGQTNSILAGTTNGSQPALAGGTDAFLTKFSPSGTLIWSTYYGGISPGGAINADYAFAVTCDKAGNVYIAGQTNSTNNISTPGSHQPALAGDADAFVAKFDSAGVRQWGTYLGGPAFDQARGLVVDAGGNVYISGGGQSTSGIASSGSAQDTLTAFSDGFLVKFNAAGVYQWGTYAGGAGYDGLGALTCDEEQNIYAAGTMGDNSNGLATNASHQMTAGGNGDAFLAKYDSTGVKYGAPIMVEVEATWVAR
jgi:Beta-propeller repeat.